MDIANGTSPGRGMSRAVALITGASSGIGAEFARQLAPRGYDLVLVARRRDRLEALAAELTAAHAGLNVRVIVKDLAQSESAGELLRELTHAGVAVELLVNNAGFGHLGRFVRQDASDAAGQIAVNVNALVALTHAFLPAMVERGTGGVINIGSTASFQPVPNMAVYGATKAFVLSFSEAVHEEVRRSGVHVVALCPGATPTEFGEIAGVASMLGPRRSVVDVVHTGLYAFEKNSAVAIDGPANVLLAASSRVAPRGLVRRIGAWMMSRSAA